MRPWHRVLTLGLLITACTSPVTAPGAEPFASTPMIEPGEFGALAPLPPDQAPVMLSGALPDGTHFDLDLGPNEPGPVEAVFATLVVELDTRSSVLWGVAERQDEIDAPDAAWWPEDDVYHLSAGDWLFRFNVGDDLVSQLGVSYRAVIEQGISGRSSLGYPILLVTSPFRWAEEEDTSRHTQVLWHDFVVRRGCGSLALECSESRLAQFIPIPRVERPLRQLPDDSRLIEAEAPAPIGSRIGDVERLR
ncbi:MAG TPA: hypothetical protein VK990_03865 [Acidimicrobiia bacterium]|nr:hypothetical protein [Acidimicrobiia bacterium]